MTRVAARVKALQEMEQLCRKGIQEEPPGSNRGPLIDEINRDAGVPVGSAYCMAAVTWCFKRLGIDLVALLGSELADASVGFAEDGARKAGILHERPFRGDVFTWRLDGDSWADHAGFVRRVLSIGGLFYVCLTAEANTSGSNAGSQDDGGGFHFRTRSFRKGRVNFIRVPGSWSPRPPVRPPRPRRAPPRIPGWAWDQMAWLDAGKRGPRPLSVDQYLRSHYRLPTWFWLWRAWRIALRKKAA